MTKWLTATYSTAELPGNICVHALYKIIRKVKSNSKNLLVGPAGFEPATIALKGRCSTY